MTLSAFGTETRFGQSSIFPSGAPQEAPRCPSRARRPAVVKAPTPLARRLPLPAAAEAAGGTVAVRRYGVGWLVVGGAVTRGGGLIEAALPLLGGRGWYGWLLPRQLCTVAALVSPERSELALCGVRQAR